MSKDCRTHNETRVERATSRRIERLCMSCVEATHCDSGAITLVSNRGDAVRLVATDTMAATLDNLQLTLGEGPSVDSTASGAPVLWDDLADPGAARQWSAFAAEAVDAGARSVFAFPLRVGAIRLGSLALYRERPAPLSDTDLTAALDAAAAMAWALLDLRPNAQSDGRETAPSYGAVVHQAAGMVTAQLDVPIAEALARIRSTAYSEGLGIEDLAKEIVGRQRRFSKEPT
jgi:hypothetical protein